MNLHMICDQFLDGTLGHVFLGVTKVGFKNQTKIQKLP